MRALAILLLVAAPAHASRWEFFEHELQPKFNATEPITYSGWFELDDDRVSSYSEFYDRTWWKGSAFGDFDITIHFPDHDLRMSTNLEDYFKHRGERAFNSDLISDERPAYSEDGIMYMLSTRKLVPAWLAMEWHEESSGTYIIWQGSQDQRAEHLESVTIRRDYTGEPQTWRLFGPSGSLPIARRIPEPSSFALLGLIGLILPKRQLSRGV